MTDELELKKQVKKLIDWIEPYRNNTRMINAVTRFILERELERS